MILLDLNLPDVSGAEVLGWLREDVRTRTIPVVVLSADASVGQGERLRAAGAREFLIKPLVVARLLAIIDAALREKVIRAPRKEEEEG